MAVGPIKQSAIAGLLALGLLLAGFCGVALSAEGGPQWRVISVSGPTNFRPGDTEDKFVIMAVNVGGQATDGSTVTITDTLPAGLTASAASGYDIYRSGSFFGAEERAPLTCEVTPTISCTDAASVDPGDTLYMEVQLEEIASSLSSPLANEVTVSGGGTAVATAQSPVTIGSAPAPFGLASGSVVGALSTLQAGAHPDVTSIFAMNRSEPYTPVEDPKDIRFDAPVGLVGNAVTVPRCSMARVAELAFNAEGCPRDSMVGMATLIVELQRNKRDASILTPVYNIAPAPGEPAAFAFDAALFPVRLDTSVLSDGDYGVRVTAPDISEAAETLYSAITLWGVPADHNGPGQDTTVFGEAFGGSSGSTRVSLLMNPTQCSTPLSSTTSADRWTEPGVFVSQEAPAGTLTGCDQVPFSSSFTMLPDTLKAGAPAGYNFELRVPREEDTSPHGLAAADVKKTVVKLPLGTVISPSAADGLSACRDEVGVDPASTPNEFGLHSLTPASCEQNAQIGTVQISSPLIAKPLDGQVYLAKPECEPCTPQDAEDGQMVKLLLQARGEGSDGLIVKVVGSLSIDQLTGQLTATFDNTPQLPFDELKLSMGGGPRAALANPRTCGPATTTTTLTPWTSPIMPELTRTFSFEVAGCQAPQFAPSFVAGTTSNQAGGFSPFTLSFARGDADEFMSGLSTRMPSGVLGMLANVKLCPEPQAAQGSCDADSEIGHVQVLTGPGAEPFLVTGGRVFITGPYKGAPYGLSILVPAKAGPYTISGALGNGTVVVRAAINVDPYTAALTVTSDPLPTVLDGIPLQLRRVDVSIDRSGFVFNPTSCDPMQITGALSSVGGATSDQASHFQVTNCAALGFKPQVSVSTSGKTSRADGASLSVKVSYPSGSTSKQANIKSVKVELPKALPSRLTTLQKACTARTFETNPASCPAESIVGHAVIHTQVLPVPLEGPAYFVSNGGAAFPNLVMVVQGYGVTVELVGNTSIKNGITSSTFASTPDVPFESVQLTLPQGKFSALAANGALCKQKLVMPTVLVGQNGASLNQNTPIEVKGCSNALAMGFKKVKDRTVTLGVWVPAAGRLSASGNGLSKASKVSHQREEVMLTLHARRRGKLASRVRLSFTSSSGKDRKTLRESLSVRVLV